MTTESLIGQRHCIFMYVSYSLIKLNISAGVFKNLRVVLLSRSLLNCLRTFASLIRNSFFGLGKFCPTPGEFDHHFLPQSRELDKKIAQVAGISSLKEIFPRVMYPVGNY